MHPRVNCVVAGCQRGTARLPPGKEGSTPEFICGSHWRSVPKPWRTRISLYRRRFFAARRKDDQRGMEVAYRCFWNRWDSSVDLLNNPQSVMHGDLPASLATRLAAQGLL